MKYYNFDSSFDTSEFLQRKYTRRCRSDTLDDTRATHCPKMSPSEAVIAYSLLVRVQLSSLDDPLVTALGITRRERGASCTS
jgi:hypothetical protein